MRGRTFSGSLIKLWKSSEIARFFASEGVEHRKNLCDLQKGKKKPLTIFIKTAIMSTRKQTQVSPSGMATASQAVPGEFDSRHLLQKDKRPNGAFVFLERFVRRDSRFSRKVRIALRSVTARTRHMSALISPLKSVINAFLYGQLVLLQPSTLPQP